MEAPTPSSTELLEAPLVVVSCDSHIGPTLDQMRPYCPAGHLDDFDAFRSSFTVEFDVWADLRPVIDALGTPDARAYGQELDRNRQTDGHFDMDARRRDMDADGVAADVIYHSSQNGQPVPFLAGGSLFFNPSDASTNEMARLGTHIYNCWLADACGTAPHRHVGVAHLPAWNIEASVAEVEWAAEAGLRAVNLPAPRPGIPVYDDPAWEPFWSACEAADITLNTHVGGAGGAIDYPGPQATVMKSLDRSGWLARRALPRLIFGGVFERHPGLRYVLTEQNGEWWATTMREYDSAYLTHSWQLQGRVPRKPSEYCAAQVFIGGSYMCHLEAAMAVADGYEHNLLWGSDYPHAEGTYQYRQDAGEENVTHLALRYAFARTAAAATQRMIGRNAIEVYKLDARALQSIAGMINAPTLAELATGVTTVPEPTACRAFRTLGPWG